MTLGTSDVRAAVDQPIIEATVSVTPEGVANLRQARVAGIERPSLESTVVGPMQTLEDCAARVVGAPIGLW